MMGNTSMKSCRNSKRNSKDVSHTNSRRNSKDEDPFWDPYQYRRPAGWPNLADRWLSNSSAATSELTAATDMSTSRFDTSVSMNGQASSPVTASSLETSTCEAPASAIYGRDNAAFANYDNASLIASTSENSNLAATSAFTSAAATSVTANHGQGSAYVSNFSQVVRSSVTHTTLEDVPKVPPRRNGKSLRQLEGPTRLHAVPSTRQVGLPTRPAAPPSRLAAPLTRLAAPPTRLAAPRLGNGDESKNHPTPEPAQEIDSRAPPAAPVPAVLVPRPSIPAQGSPEWVDKSTARREPVLKDLTCGCREWVYESTANREQLLKDDFLPCGCHESSHLSPSFTCPLGQASGPTSNSSPVGNQSEEMNSFKEKSQKKRKAARKRKKKRTKEEVQRGNSTGRVYCLKHPEQKTEFVCTLCSGRLCLVCLSGECSRSRLGRHWARFLRTKHTSDVPGAESCRASVNSPLPLSLERDWETMEKVSENDPNVQQQGNVVLLSPHRSIDSDSDSLPELVPMSSDSEDLGSHAFLDRCSIDPGSTSSMEEGIQKESEKVKESTGKGHNANVNNRETPSDQYCDECETELVASLCRHCRCLLCQNCQIVNHWCDHSSSEDHDNFISLNRGAKLFMCELKKLTEEKKKDVASAELCIAENDGVESTLNKNVADVCEAVCKEFDSIIDIIRSEKNRWLSEIDVRKTRIIVQVKQRTSAARGELPKVCELLEESQQVGNRLLDVEAGVLSDREICVVLRDSREVLDCLSVPLTYFSDKMKPVGRFEYSPQHKIGRTELCSRLDALYGVVTQFDSRGEFLQAWGEKAEESEQIVKQEPCPVCARRAEDSLQSLKEDLPSMDLRSSKDDLRSPKEDLRSPKEALSQPVDKKVDRKPRKDVTSSHGVNNSEAASSAITADKRATADVNRGSRRKDPKRSFPPCEAGKEFNFRQIDFRCITINDATIPGNSNQGWCFSVGADGIFVSGIKKTFRFFRSERCWRGGICSTTDGQEVFVTNGTKRSVDFYRVNLLREGEALSHSGIIKVPGAKNLQGICYRPADDSLIIADTKANKLIIMKRWDKAWHHVQDIKTGESGFDLFNKPLYVASGGSDHVYVTHKAGLTAVNIDTLETLWDTEMEGPWTVFKDGDRLFVTHGRPSIEETSNVPGNRVSIVSTVRGKVIRSFTIADEKAVKICPKRNGQYIIVSCSH